MSFSLFPSPPDRGSLPHHSPGLWLLVLSPLCLRRGQAFLSAIRHLFLILQIATFFARTPVIRPRAGKIRTAEPAGSPGRFQRLLLHQRNCDGARVFTMVDNKHLRRQTRDLKFIPLPEALPLLYRKISSPEDRKTVFRLFFSRKPRKVRLRQFSFHLRRHRRRFGGLGQAEACLSPALRSAAEAVVEPPGDN